MNTFYLIIVVVLFFLAISDLIVGVANDAVNFLNSAIGARAAKFAVVMTIASVGVFVGASFSSGMMEVARKGIFHPDQFYFSEIILIFLAVMITDVLLLNVFNTLGLPTSTTVSLVFELLGSAVAISIAKIAACGETLLELNKYINSSKALAIISSILISIFVGFVVGAIIQYIARIIFSFNLKKSMKYYGAIWGALSFSVITYFIIIKGIEGATFISESTLNWIKEHTFSLMIYGIIGFTIIFQLLYWIFKINILKLIVFYGTFALAVAFAGNDLVNFIGVPLAGFKSYQMYISSGVPADQFLMEGLKGKVQTEEYMLLIAGLVIVLTLWFSKKARTVIKTSVDLSRQESGDERFASSPLSRSIVRFFVQLNNSITSILPKSFLRFVNERFKPYKPKNINSKDMPAFDMLRASVNLMVASTLIAFGTSLKLPLSTTYITFMVAMGSSLSDRAWGRESAVYRISGVFVVIGGWFITALVAFVVSLTVAFIIFYGGVIAVILVLLLAAFLSYRTHTVYLKREKKSVEEANFSKKINELSEEQIYETCINNSVEILKTIPKIYSENIKGLTDEQLKTLKKINKEVIAINDKTKLYKSNVPIVISQFTGEYIDSAHYYVQMLDYLREIAHCLSYIVTPSYEYINNNHKGFINSQKEDLVSLYSAIKEFFDDLIKHIEKGHYDKTESIVNKQQEIINLLENLRKKQLKRIKNDETGVKNSMLYMNILTETKNLLLYVVNLYKSQRDFVNSKKNKF
jgi:phosphate/sulfate permease